MNILIDIQQKIDSFTSTEKLIGEFILNHPKAVISMTSEQFASKIHVSTASLVRFSRTIGLSGLTELKQRLSASVTDLNNAEYLKEVGKDDSVNNIKNKISVRIRHMTDKTNELLDDDEITKSVNLIHKSTNIFVYGIGASGLVAQDLFQKFSRVGKHFIFVEDIHVLVTAMSAITDNTCIILISNSGETSEIVDIAKTAIDLGMSVISITGNPKSKLADSSNIVLLSESGESIKFRTAATISLMAQLYVVDILFYRFVSLNFENSMLSINKSHSIARSFDKDDTVK
ncbi:MurR/RpiR family transcriptional regulator [Companilactobacillus sp. HBUAS59544]|jgi:DNA-binding MurR/RpiR family transcriptional regulator|uniref:MurR/RpiR family transcriptional regulator n=1 Tax=Companilactobacillus sp. HBUAS59544 TaxID=3109363 RepID=UPI002FF2C940